MPQDLPNSAVVLRGCWLATIHDSVYSAFGGISSRGWSENVYLYCGGDGNSASIAFRGTSFVACVFDHDSPRSPWRGNTDVGSYFRSLPDDHRELGKQCLYYNQEKDGAKVWLITAAFWDEGQSIKAGEPWSDVWEHGAHVLSHELADDLETSLRQFREDYGLGPKEAALTRSLSKRKIAHPNEPVFLTRREVQFLEAGEPSFDDGVDPRYQQLKQLMRATLPMMRGQTRSEVLEEARQNLAAIGIHWPN